MPNANVAEKERTGPPGVLRNCSGVGCTAWPLRFNEPLVSSSRPDGVIGERRAGEARVDELVVVTGAEDGGDAHKTDEQGTGEKSGS
nr:unnamed protein product [Digitaria exilis]